QLLEDQLQLHDRPVSGVQLQGSVDTVPGADGLQRQRPEQAEPAFQPAELELGYPRIELQLVGLRESPDQLELPELRELELRHPGEHPLRGERVELVDREQHVEQRDRRVQYER